MIFCREFVGTCVIMGLIGAPISMFGDLTASAYKRKMGIKDYGNLIPGHGGIMDRFDSILFTAPFIYYYTAIILMHFHIIF
jgi:phosphatidate cytidylyltransferase